MRRLVAGLAALALLLAGCASGMEVEDAIGLRDRIAAETGYCRGEDSGDDHPGYITCHSPEGGYMLQLLVGDSYMEHRERAHEVNEAGGDAWVEGGNWQVTGYPAEALRGAHEVVGGKFHEATS